MKHFLSLPFLFLWVFGQHAVAQQYTSQDQAYFQQKLPGFQLWLEAYDLDQMVETSHVEAQHQKLTVYLQSVYPKDEQLKAAWRKLETNYVRQNKIRLSEKLFDQASFLFQVDPSQIEIVVLGHDQRTSRITLSFDESFHVDTNFPTAMEGGLINISVKDIQLSPTAKRMQLGKGSTVEKVTKSLSDFIIKYYQDKEGPYLYKANIDTDRSYYQSFNYRITCLNDEILSGGRGYYEYIQFKVKVQQVGDDIGVYYDIIGAYAPTILCPKGREAFYTPITETNSPGKLAAYAEHMAQLMEEHLKYQ